MVRRALSSCAPYSILYNACGQKDRKPEGGGEEPGGPKWREISGRGQGSLPVSPHFSFNLKFKFLFTFGYTVDLPHEISFFVMFHSTLQWFWLLCNFVIMLAKTSLQVKIKNKPNTKNYISLIIKKLKICFCKKC